VALIGRQNVTVRLPDPLTFGVTVGLGSCLFQECQNSHTALGHKE